MNDKAYLKTGSVYAGKYRLHYLWKEHNGVIYKAKDCENNEEVVIKGFSPKRELQNYLDEVATTSRLSHPSIVKTLHVFQENSYPYLVLESLPQTIYDFFAVKTHEAFTSRLFLFLEQMSQTISYLSSERVFHRDLNPGNILLNKEGIVTLIDFGNAIDCKAKPELSYALQTHGDVFSAVSVARLIAKERINPQHPQEVALARHYPQGLVEFIELAWKSNLTSQQFQEELSLLKPHFT